MPPARPSFLLVAGPNGSGKSTISAGSRATLFATTRIVDPDADAAAPHEFAAARASIATVDAALEARESLVVETTLAGARGTRLLQRAGRSGYRRALFYICTESVEINLERIAARVAAGGHDVPEADVRRRFVRSIDNVDRAIDDVEEFTLLDNSTSAGPTVVAHGFLGRVLHRRNELPAWSRDVIEKRQARRD